MSVEAKLLAEVIKSVHRRLRKELNQTCDPESVWLKHCNDETLLKVPTTQSTLFPHVLHAFKISLNPSL